MGEIAKQFPQIALALKDNHFALVALIVFIIAVLFVILAKHSIKQAEKGEQPLLTAALLHMTVEHFLNLCYVAMFIGLVGFMIPLFINNSHESHSTNVTSTEKYVVSIITKSDEKEARRIVKDFKKDGYDADFRKVKGKNMYKVYIRNYVYAANREEAGKTELGTLLKKVIARYKTYDSADITRLSSMDN